MTSGIYAYWDNVKNYYVYVGKDNKINAKKNRNYQHMLPSRYEQQQINRVLQNNPDRYEYRVIMQGDYDDWELNQMEKLCIKSFKTFRKDYPERNVFNFTEGGDGISGWKHSVEAKKQAKERMKDKNNPGYRHDLDDYTIIDLYINKHLSTNEIADKLNTNNQTIRDRLIKNNIKLRSLSEAAKGKYIGKNNPNKKYNIWNINSVYYNKYDMLKHNGGNKPKKVFKLKYNCEKIPIGAFMDFTTPEIINDLICEAIDN